MYVYLFSLGVYSLNTVGTAAACHHHVVVTELCAVQELSLLLVEAVHGTGCHAGDVVGHVMEREWNILDQ